MGIEVEERPLSIDEIIDAYKNGQLQGIVRYRYSSHHFNDKRIRYRDFVMTFETEKWKIAPEIGRTMNAIKEGKAEDKYGWMVKV